MAFSLKVNKDKSVLSEGGGGGSFIATSGIYDVTIKFVAINEKNGKYTFSMNVDYKGKPTTLYGPFLTNNDGSDNVIGKELLNKLLIIGGIPADVEPEIENEIHTVGKDDEEREFSVITALSDLDVKVQVKEEFTLYKGKVRRDLVIYNFFSAEGATAAEMVAIEDGEDVEVGAQLAKIAANEATTQYRLKANTGTKEPAPTDAQVAEYIESKKKGSKAKAPAAKAAAKKRPAFGR